MEKITSPKSLVRHPRDRAKLFVPPPPPPISATIKFQVSHIKTTSKPVVPLPPLSFVGIKLAPLPVINDWSYTESVVDVFLLPSGSEQHEVLLFGGI